MAGSDRDGEFRAAYPALYLRAYQAAFRVCGDRTEAGDLAQEAMVRAYVHWSRLDERREGWVVTTTVRLAIDRWRRQQRAAKRHDEVAEASIDDVAAERLDLMRLLADLPRRQREVAVLRYLEDWPERDVAQALGCSVGSVKRHAARALTALRAAAQAPASPILEER